MTLYEILTRPLTHRWVAINRTTERVVTEAQWQNREDGLRAAVNECLRLNRGLACMTRDYANLQDLYVQLRDAPLAIVEPVKAKRERKVVNAKIEKTSNGLFQN